MHSPIIEVKNIGKKYDIAHMQGGYVALRDVIANVLRRPFSFLKHKAKRAVGLEKSEEFWALRNVNFAVNRGEVIGVIGANGAGKSTLLKILSQITPPTEGEVIIRGRVGSLLEVGTGFHPELTGRENIFLNGAILGMKKKEIAAKFDDIVTFAGVEKFLDTPVKHYSSGMYVRLAFSVAAHMEPDILLVDEVLAVGDAEFQKKCLGKMDEITRSHGRTILFVSHNLEAIRELCSKTILFENGRVAMIGPTDDVIARYSNTAKARVSTDLSKNPNRRGDGRVRLTGFSVKDHHGQPISSVESGGPAIFEFTYNAEDPHTVKELDLGFSVHRDGHMLAIVYSSEGGNKVHKVESNGIIRFKIDHLPFGAGEYTVGARLLADGIEVDWPKDPVGMISVHGSNPKSIIPLQGSWS